ncbi:MAG: hypothetical protein OXF88_00655 [Rhodobacteraceae bacterium]|nr:hypothetical protein [Paracoccaceae bacterium]MCY4136879.1 hypothetical protein [Paracoccaceae bacterium]
MSAWTKKTPVENTDEALSEALSVARLSCLDDRENLGAAMANLMNRIAGKSMHLWPPLPAIMIPSALAMVNSQGVDRLWCGTTLEY